jgi:aspartyl-tRNA synthetase
MSFVDQEDVIDLFEDMCRHLFKELLGVQLPDRLQQMTWHEAMRRFGSDKPDLRFGMEFVELMDVLQTGSFAVFDQAAYIGGICVPGCADYTRKQLDQLTDFVKRPQVGAKGLVYVKYNSDGTIKNQVLYSLYGYIRVDQRNNIVVVDNGSANLFNINTGDAAANFNRLPAVRYILPYPEEAIARSNGVYKNYYGY